jgi:homoserine O-succinyltransferase/O-acetyltransferase
MPVCLDHDLSSRLLLPRLRGVRRSRPFACQSNFRSLEIGLLNNMPDGALESAERQFVTLLDRAAAGMVVRLALFALPEVPRSEPGRRHVKRFYSAMESLWDRALDGLIVTGTEPRTASLKDEPYWESLAKVLDWADRNTHSTILSCLSAHAALLHFDGIERRRLEEKRFGVFECLRVSNHPLISEVPERLRIPQSRWNDVPEDELTAAGYGTLTRLRSGGVDALLKQRRSLFVFFQGHPEYEADTLFLEYRRDVGRYLRGETDSYPSLPANYLSAKTTGALTAFRERALRNRRTELLTELSAVPAGAARNPWRAAAAAIYGNWLGHLYREKERRPGQHSLKRNALSYGAGR